MTTTNDTVSYATQLHNLYLAARNEKRVKRESWLQNYRLLHNRVGMLPASQWQPNPRSSEIYPIVANLIAWMTDSNINLDINPASDPHSDWHQFQQTLANELSAVLFSTWQTLAFDQQVKLMLWDAMQTGTGLFKCSWDQGLDDGFGNVMLTRTDPYFVYPDPHATSLADAEYVVEARMMSLGEIERRWPDHALELDALGAGEDNGLDPRPRNMRGDGAHIPVNPGGQTGSFRWQYGGAQNEPGDPLARYPVYEYWIRHNTPTYNDRDEKSVDGDWKVVVVSRGVILLEEWATDLFPFDDHPYVDFRFDDVGEFWGIALIDHMAAPQRYINRLLTALQMNAEMTGNPIFVEPSNSGINRSTIPARPGNRLTVNASAMAAGGRPDWLTPPQMPPQVLELVNFWIQRLENLSGMSAMTKGQTPPTQRSAQGTVNTIQEAAFVRVRAAQRNLERTLEAAARKLADLIIANYTQARTMAIVGPGGKQASIALRARHFLHPGEAGAEPLKYSLLVQAGASAPTSRSARIVEADKLFAMGAIDDQAVLEAHQYPNLQDLLKRKNEKQAVGMHQPPGARQKAGRLT